MLALAGGLAYARRRWRARSSKLIDRLRPRESNQQAAIVSAAETDSLPAPVRRYLRNVLEAGQPTIRRARFSQQGDFLVRPEKDRWRPFTAEQHVVARPPGFVWSAEIRILPGLTVQVRDAFLDGAGLTQASLLGLVPLVSAEGSADIAAGALHRYLAESVWFPTSLLPARGPIWTPLDETSARATLGVAGTTVSLDFHFDSNDFVASVFTPARAREVDGRFVPTPWQGRFFDYTEAHGMLIPLAAEVEWLLPDGPQVYWRGLITKVSYEFDEP